MRVKALTIGLVSLFVWPYLAIVGSPIAGLSGQWVLTVTWADGTRGTPTLELQQTDEKLTGTYSGGLGKYPITGTVIGRRVHIEVQISEAFKKANPKLAELKYDGESNDQGTTMTCTTARPDMKGSFTANRK